MVKKALSRFAPIFVENLLGRNVLFHHIAGARQDVYATLT